MASGLLFYCFECIHPSRFFFLVWEKLVGFHKCIFQSGFVPLWPEQALEMNNREGENRRRGCVAPPGGCVE